MKDLGRPLDKTDRLITVSAMRSLVTARASASLISLYALVIKFQDSARPVIRNAPELPIPPIPIGRPVQP